MQEQKLETPSELTLLKTRADTLGITYHTNIGVDKLKLKIENKLDGVSDSVEEVAAKPVPQAPQKETIMQRNTRLRQEASKLVRIRVVCMNPEKKSYTGEIITVSNAVVGTFKKFVSFGNDEGWHVPNIIYKQLLERRCQTWVTSKVNGKTVKKSVMIKEFAVEVLDPLTPTEMKDLATKQAMSQSID